MPKVSEFDFIAFKSFRQKKYKFFKEMPLANYLLNRK